MNQIVDCNKCKAPFTLKLKQRELEGNISKVFFECPRCKEEYLVHYTNVLLEAKQARLRNLNHEYNTIREVNPIRAEKLWKRRGKLKKEIVAEMNKLEKLVEQC